MPKSYWTKIQTPNGLKYFRADEVTDELLDKLKDETSNIFWAEYNVTSFDDIKDAYDAGKSIYVVKSETIYAFIYSLKQYDHYEEHPNLDQFVFTCMCRSEERIVYCFPSNWQTGTMRTFANNSDVVSLGRSVALPWNFIPTPIAEGTYAMRDYVLYRANTTITGSVWDASQWDEVKVGDKLKELDEKVAEQKTFFATVFTTPYSEIKAAYDAGRSIIAVNGHAFYHMFDYNESAGYERFRFSLVQGNTFLLWTCNKTGYDGTHGWNPQPDVGSCAYQGDIAPRYSSESTYDVGDLAYSDGGLLYRCTTAISTPEIWNSNHWTSTTVAQVLKRVESSSKIAVFYVDYNMGQKVYPNPDEILAAIDAGKFVVIDAPNQGAWNHLEWLLENAGRGVQDYIKFVNGSGTLIATRDNTADEPTWQWNTEYLYDDQLDANSVNAVQNATLYAIINDLQSRVAALEGN